MAAKGYKHYDKLVDLAFFAYILQSVIPVLRLFGLTAFATSGGWTVLSAVLFLSTWLLLVVLVVRRAWRDEYAQALWDQSAASFAKLLAVAPLPLAVLLTMALQAYQTEISATPLEQMPQGDTQDASLGASGQQFLTISRVLLLIGVYFPFLFIAIYKWHRWRDG